MPRCEYCPTEIEEGDFAFFPSPNIMACKQCYRKRLARWEEKHPGTEITMKTLRDIFRPAGEKQITQQRLL
jgi:hypothetical protein